MTDPKPDLEKFDPGEWISGNHVNVARAILNMLEGLPVFHAVTQRFYRLTPDGFKVYYIATGEWYACSIDDYDNGHWRIAVRKAKPQPKPEPVKPAESTADEILDALMVRKRVVDADGCEVDLFWRDERHGDWIRNVRFPLTIKPEPKPRRRVTREEAIIAMVKDQGQHAWLESGHEIRMWNGVMCQGLFDGTWIVATGVDQEFLYLDPPEGEG